jgi:hypothetical protein
VPRSRSMKKSNKLNRVFGLIKQFHPDWLFEAKFDEFLAAADTVRGRLISRKAALRAFPAWDR